MIPRFGHYEMRQKIFNTLSPNKNLLGLLWHVDISYIVYISPQFFTEFL